jgi:hypothetical protein
LLKILIENVLTAAKEAGTLLKPAKVLFKGEYGMQDINLG